MNLDRRREQAADLIEAAYGRGCNLSLIRRDGRSVAQIWSAKGSLLTEYEGADERNALVALMASPAFQAVR